LRRADVQTTTSFVPCFDATASKTRPAMTTIEAAIRRRPKLSPRNSAPMQAANTTLVSGRATTDAIGATDMANSATA
jgi:hypothetical protein